MPQPLVRLFSILFLVALVALTTVISSGAESAYRPLAVASPYDLINSVNALRVSYGLAPYSINAILMNTAQAQADFMASTETVTHSGPDGIGLTARLLAAGYPLAGDLLAGGFRAENITSGNEDRTAQSVVEGWTGDALHLNTMISPNLSEIGAGVAIANGRVYFVIDCALPITEGLPQSSTSAAGNETTSPSPEERISVAALSTPNSDGDIIHEVQPGQSLWQLAIAYDVKIDDIKQLNNLSDDNIYPGNKLLIKTDAVLPTASPISVPTLEPSEAAVSTSTLLPTVTIIFSTATTSPELVNSNSIMGVAMGIIVLALLGGAFFTGLGSKRKTEN